MAHLEKGRTDLLLEKKRKKIVKFNLKLIFVKTFCCQKRKESVNQCDQMAKLSFQYWAISNNEN